MVNVKNENFMCSGDFFVHIIIKEEEAGKEEDKRMSSVYEAGES